MKQIYALIVMLMMASVAFTGCVSDDGDDTDDVDDTVDPVGTESTSTLDTVIARGVLKCGVKDSQYGMGYLEADGTYTGLDIEYCKAVAAAVLGDANKVKYVPATAKARFEMLKAGEIDVNQLRKISKN